MKIRDIVNRDIVNLENCESEPIHVPGSIQPHGFLLALDPETLSVRFCSGNVQQFTGLSYEQLLDKNISSFLSEESFTRLSGYIKRESVYAEVPINIDMNGVLLECVSHNNGASIVLEFEPQSDELSDANNVYLQTRQFIEHMETSDSLQSLCQSVADEIRKITGYDRVMVYRFDELYNGEVFAESLDSRFEPFLGLHYPHTDIPVQARELYIKNLLRLIVDINYTPVPIYTTGEGASSGLDMSLTALRSVSPIHIQYLQNMGVGATLTISLIHQQKLWGLIACHHYGRKHLSNKVKVSAKLQGHFLTSQIRVREAHEEYILSKELDRNLQTLIAENVRVDRGSLQTLTVRKELLNICNASGVAFVIDDHIYCGGEVPGGDEIKKLVDWLSKRPDAEFITDRLSTVYEGGKAISGEAAGVLYQSLGNNNSIIWFRHETQREVHWAGDPDKSILKDDNGLHPRKSFSLWKEVVKGRSSSWQKPELDAASNFTRFFQRQVHLMFIFEEEARYRALNNKLAEANAELENLNWISTHDLKEPLRKIQVFASRIMEDSKEIPPHIQQKIGRMQSAAERMQLLLNDLLAYSRITRISEAMQHIDLNALLQNVLEELEEETAECHGQITSDSLPVVSGVSFLIKQVFVNLLRNALKFRKAGKAPVIVIHYEGLQPLEGKESGRLYHRITISDNGIGFDNEKSKNIFDVFVRLNNHETYAGSGVGLALCKKIMANHGGAISAQGLRGEGAVFTLHFPVNQEING